MANPHFSNSHHSLHNCVQRKLLLYPFKKIATEPINRHTGEIIEGWDLIFQLIDDLFTTRFRERVQRRLYGSNVPDQIDKPINEDFVLDAFVAAANAIEEFLSSVVKIEGFGLLEATEQGKTRFAIELVRLDTGETNSYEAII